MMHDNFIPWISRTAILTNDAGTITYKCKFIHTDNHE